MRFAHEAAVDFAMAALEVGSPTKITAQLLGTETSPDPGK